jgi:hypothetical protein
MTDSSVLDFIPQNSPLRTLNSPKSAFGSKLIQVVQPVMIFLSFESRFYKAEKVFNKHSKTREYIPNVHGKIEAVTIVNPKNTQRVNVQGSCLNEETNEKERWILSFSTVKKQQTYLSLLPKLKVVNLPEQSLTIQPRLGNRATFMDVFINGDPRQSVYAKSIDCSDNALNETVNAIREQLGLQPEYPEWMNLRTDLSQTQSVPTNCETYSEEPESSSQSQI